MTDQWNKSVDAAEHFLKWLADETCIELRHSRGGIYPIDPQALADEYATWCEENKDWYGPDPTDD